MGKSTLVAVLAGAAIIGGLIGAGTVDVTSAEKRELQLQAAALQPNTVVSANQVSSAQGQVVASAPQTAAGTAQPSATIAPAATISPEKAFISAEQAGEIAVKYAQGTIVKIERDKENGKLYYEVELRMKDGEAEVKIDAVTGGIVEVEYDTDDDLYDDDDHDDDDHDDDDDDDHDDDDHDDDDDDRD